MTYDVFGGMLNLNTKRWTLLNLNLRHTCVHEC